MRNSNFLLRFLGFPSLELCGSKLYKTGINNAKFDRDGQWLPFFALYIPVGITCLLVFTAKGIIAPIVGVLVLALLGFLLFYDLDAFLCYFDKDSEYYRATGVTKEDINKDKGLAGEFNAYVLSRKIKVPHKTLYNVCVPMPNGNFQEVDAIIITQHEIYVIECKNRSGGFEIDFEKATWTQYLGKQEHKVPNIYIQNQEHIVAIDNYLKSMGLIKEFTIYYNLLLTGGDAFFNSVKVPDNFSAGNLYHIAGMINQKERGNKNNHGESFMEDIYMALLPYALNKKGKKEWMVQERERRAKNKELSRGNYRYYRFDGGVQMAAYGLLTEEALIRKDDVYTQLGVFDGAYYYWTAMPNMTYIEDPDHAKETV